MPVRGLPWRSAAPRSLLLRAAAGRVGVSLRETGGGVGGPATSEMTQAQLVQGAHDSGGPCGCSAPAKGVITNDNAAAGDWTARDTT